MCGRDYSIYTDDEIYFRYLNRRPWRWTVREKIPAFKPNYNMCPTQTGLVLSVSDGTIALREMRWGLVPAWAKTVKDADKYSMINAKCEEIAEKRSYKSAFQRRRCIVPVSGFFEWRRDEKTKKPFAIYLKDDPIMSLAGIWEHWTSKVSAEEVESFSIVTTAANSFMAKIHSRMPVILNQNDEERWLDPEVTESAAVSDLMKACPSEALACTEISTLVNSPKNNSPEVLAGVPHAG
jgi:putative SOS response-associated peptidase YedK